MQCAKALLFRATLPRLVGLTTRHIEWPNTRNKASDTFEFTPDSYEEVKRILAKYPESKKQSAVIPLLHLVQVQHGGWIPLSGMLKVAEVCQLPQKKVFEVACFYCMFNHKPAGKYHILVCMTTPCMLRGSDEIMHALEHHLGVGEDEVTPDGLFSVGEMECMGCCANAPMICVTDYSDPKSFKYDFFEDLTVERAIEIVEMLKRGEYPKQIGSQIGRQGAMPEGGRTSLFEKPAGPFCRDLSQC